MRSDVTLCSWNSPAPLAGNTGLYLSRSVSAKQSGWLQNLGTNDEGKCAHCTTTCPRHQPLWIWSATWITSLTHGRAYHKTSLTNQLVNEESGYRYMQKDIILNICYIKTGSFQSQHTTHLSHQLHFWANVTCFWLCRVTLQSSDFTSP